MYSRHGQLIVQFFVLGILTLLGTIVQAEDARPTLPPDELVAIAVKTLMKGEKTEALCILVQDETNITNISQSLYSSLKRKYARFFECTGSDSLFIVGPLRQDKDRGAILNIHRVLDDSPCMYQVKRRGEKWELKKLPCIVL